MDGVLVASEKTWIETESQFLVNIFGQEISEKIGDTVGMSVGDIYKKAVTFGAKFDKSEYDRLCLEAATRVYSKCPISDGVDELVAYLLSKDWILALLSSSPMMWIEQVVSRLSWRDKLSTILSLDDHPTFPVKPAPDGYTFLIKKFGAQVMDCVALEDSNPGIASAKSAGLFTIAYREHLPIGYMQMGADVVAENMKDVISILVSRSHKKALR